MFQCKMLSSLTKVFADQEPVEEKLPLSILRGETASCQVAVKSTGSIRVAASAPGFRVTVRDACQVPVGYACPAELEDDDYLRKTPGLYPDLLRPLGPNGERVRTVGWWTSYWVDAEPEDGTSGGDHVLTVRVTGENEACFEETVCIHLVDCHLPEQTLLHTEWFHGDCLADYYHVEPLSEEHWTILEKFIRSAVRMGLNMILTPIFTPALDTVRDGERTTVQLVDVFVENGAYRFGFEKLERWIKLCRECGMVYFEMAHLYTQWSSDRAPKVMATVDGEYKRIFGWETEGTGEEYRAFLAAFLPQLTKKLEELGVAEYCRFHVTDEPSESFLPCYLQEKAQVTLYLQGYKMMDALSEFSFYEQGAVEYPVVATNSHDLPKFLAADMPELWLYYCCGQTKDVSNRFIAMPSYRTRILGVQLYRYKVAGFLQWGFNFYNAVISLYHIDPFAITDGDRAYPAGDPFIVYPGEDGEPLESIRYMTLRQGLHDLRALQLLESLAGRETVEAIIAEGLEEELTLTNYPRNNVYLHDLRQRVNAEIEKRI